MHTILESPRNVIALKLSGKLTKHDVETYEKLIDERIASDEIFGLLIDLSDFGDTEPDALAEDLKYEFSLFGKLKSFPKIALLSDKQWLNTLIRTTGHLLPGVDVKTFRSEDQHVAMNFAADLPKAGDDTCASIIEIPSGIPNLLGFEIKGKICMSCVEPYVERLKESFATHEKIDLLVRLNGYSGYDSDLFGQRSLYELKRDALKHVRRYAIVGAKPWMHGLIKMVDPFIKMEVRAFDPDEEDDAWKWLKS